MEISTVVAAVLGGVGSSVVFHPLDTILTLQQTSITKSYILPYKQYWRGLTASVVLSTPAFTTYVVTYRQTKKELAPYCGKDSAATYIGAGVTAEFISNIFWTPMEVIKGRMQLKSGNNRESTANLIRQIYHADGLKGFFRGYWMSLAIYTPSSICYWYVYENLKKLTRKHWAKSNDLTIAQYTVTSSVATILAESTSNFLDVVKTRQQLAVSEEVRRIRPNDRIGLATVARNLIEEAGLFKALVKGLHIRLLYALPSGVLAMAIVESIDPEAADDLE